MGTNTFRTGTLAITGASGQVGRALQQRLAELPDRVLPLGRGDDLTAGPAGAQVLVHPPGPVVAPVSLGTAALVRRGVRFGPVLAEDGRVARVPLRRPS